MLTLENLTVCNNNHILVNQVSLNIYRSSINALVGPSGSGKSLTAMAIVDQIPHNLEVSNYNVILNGQKITRLNHILGKTIGVITQDYSHSFNTHHKIGKQLVRIYKYHFKVSKQEATNQVIKSLSHVELDQRIMKQYSFNLSGGQLQRVQIASVLMLNPDVIIADEITSSLDRMTGKKIMNIIQHIAKDHGQTFLLITHDISHVESYADIINVMNQGQLIASGNLKNIQNSNHKLVKDILTKLEVRSKCND